MSTQCPNETGAETSEREAVRSAVHLFVLCITPILTFLGIAANTVNIVVLTRKWMASSTNYYLTALAITDVVYLLLFYMITVKFYPGVTYLAWFTYLLAAMFPLANLFSNFATWLTCFFTFERWVVVYKPMFGRKYCTKERARHIICVIFFATLVFTLPNFLEYRVASRSPGVANVTSRSPVVYYLDKTEAYLVMKNLGYYHVFTVLFIFGPLVFLAVFNSLLIGSVVRAKKKQEQLSAALIVPRRPSATPRPSQQFAQMPQMSRGSVCSAMSLAGVSGSGGAAIRASRTILTVGRPKLRAASEQQKITIMLISVVILFCLCQLPSAFVTLRKAIEPHGNSKCKGGRFDPILSAIVNLLLLVNAASNFVLYSCFSTKFRKTFRKVFLVCGRQGNADVTTCVINDFDRTPRCSEPNIHELQTLQQAAAPKTCLLQVPTPVHGLRRVSH